MIDFSDIDIDFEMISEIQTENTPEKIFMTKEKFAAELCNLTKEHKINYFDAVIMYCDDNELEIEEVFKFFDQNLKERIELGAIENNLVAEKPTLFQ